MAKIKHLPDAEFEIMRIVWGQFGPIASGEIEKLLSEVKVRHISTINTLLRRLVSRGFLSAEKRGKEFIYSPLVSHDDYINAETEYFMEKIHNTSLIGFINAFYSNKKPSDEDIAEMEEWLSERND